MPEPYDYRDRYPQVAEEDLSRIQIIEQTDGAAAARAEIQRLNGSGNRRSIATTDIADVIGDVTNLMSVWRRRNVPPTLRQPISPAAPVKFADEGGGTTDWRVKISNPFGGSGVLAPLGGALTFPIQPQITIQHQANYDEVAPIHNNYAFPAYQNSSLGQITVVGEFPVQHQEDGLYWIAATHMLRSATKMYYGNSSNKGAPPPIVKLNGYGQYTLNNIPCLVESFTTDLPNGVDYIKAGGTWVPTDSVISVVLKPVYSRDKVNRFSLDAFASGGLISQGYI